MTTNETRLTKSLMAETLADCEPSTRFGEQRRQYWVNRYMELTVAELAERTVVWATGPSADRLPADLAERLGAVAELAKL